MDEEERKAFLSEVQFEKSTGATQEGTEGDINSVILRQISKCVAECSKELTQGGIQTRYIQGQVVEIAVPNQMEIIINSIQALYFLSINALNKYKEKNDKVKESLETLEKSQEDLEDEHKKRSKEIDKEWEAHSIEYQTKYSDMFVSRWQKLSNWYEKGKVELSKQMMAIIINLIIGEELLKSELGGTEDSPTENEDTK